MSVIHRTFWGGYCKLKHPSFPGFSLKPEENNTKNDGIQTILEFTGVLARPLLIHHRLYLCSCQENRKSLNLQTFLKGSSVSTNIKQQHKRAKKNKKRLKESHFVYPPDDEMKISPLKDTSKPEYFPTIAKLTHVGIYREHLSFSVILNLKDWDSRNWMHYF